LPAQVIAINPNSIDLQQQSLGRGKILETNEFWPFAGKIRLQK
jgi:hypothetical protein